MSLTMTESAARRIASLLAEDGRPDAAFRVRVDGGGCMGFRYVFDVDATAGEGDVRTSLGGGRLAVDPISAPFLHGAVLDWVEEMTGDRFEVRNPNAVSSCGCGTSFSA